MWAARYPFHGMLDDVEAISTLYSVRFGKRFLEKPQTVLFVDVGATSTKSYRVTFAMNGTTPLANMASYEWTEFPDLEISLPSINSVVRRAVSGMVDVVQVFGGGSRNSSIIDTIQDAVGPGVEIRKDLPNSEAIALGGAYCLRDSIYSSGYIRPNMTRSSIYNVWIECGNNTEIYCYHGEECETGAIMEYSYCEELVIGTSIDAVPEGASATLGLWELVNISEFKKAKTCGGMILFTPPFPIIEGVLWCANKDMDCRPIEIRQKRSRMDDLANAKARAFVDAIELGMKEERKATEVRAKIDEVIEKLENVNDDEVKKSVDYAKEVVRGDVGHEILEIILGELELHNAMCEVKDL
jgi:hypothetical protein